MIQNTKNIVSLVFQSVLKVLGFLVLISSLFSTLDFLKNWSLFPSIYKLTVLPFLLVYNELLKEVISNPILFIIITLFSISLYFFFWRRLELVAGEFVDGFNNGLEKWEFGGEGWKIESEDKKCLLSVSESQDGGITKKGFTWYDYEFSFQNKIINHNVGWIVRAENRTKYIMIQLHFEDDNNPKLRLHYRVNNKDYQWVVAQEDKLQMKKMIKKMEWFFVKITVNGSNIDVEINNEHVVHYFIADPIRFSSIQDVIDNKGETIRKQPETVVINYAAGKVGFRCAPVEHAHFRNVKVKPIL